MRPFKVAPGAVACLCPCVKPLYISSCSEPTTTLWNSQRKHRVLTLRGFASPSVVTGNYASSSNVHGLEKPSNSHLFSDDHCIVLSLLSTSQRHLSLGDLNKTPIVHKGLSPLFQKYIWKRCPTHKYYKNIHAILQFTSSSQ